MCCRAVSDRAAVTTWWKHSHRESCDTLCAPTRPPAIIISLLADKKHVVVFGLIRPDFSLRQRRACWVYCAAAAEGKESETSQLCAPQPEQSTLTFCRGAMVAKVTRRGGASGWEAAHV